MGAVEKVLQQRGQGGEQTGKGGVAVPNDENIRNFQKTILSYRGTWERLLPRHLDTDTFIGIAGGALWKNRELAAAALASPESFLNALRECARLGHQPGTDQYALTTRKIGESKRPTVVGIEQYQGVIERMYRAGAVQSVHAEVVLKGEIFIPQDPAPPLHRVPGDDWLSRDPIEANLHGVYAYAILEGGACSRVVKMGRPEVMRHREAAGTFKFWDGPWAVSMWLKTATHELEKWVPTSAEYRQEQARAAATMAEAMRQPTPGAPPGPEQRDAGVSVLDGIWSDMPPADDAPPADPWPTTAQPGSGGDA